MLPEDLDIRRPIRVSMNAQGRIVIPADVRRDLGLRPGERLILQVDAETRSIRLTRPRDALARLQELIAARHPDDGSRWSDELVAARRQEAQRDSLDDPSGTARNRRARPA